MFVFGTQSKSFMGPIELGIKVLKLILTPQRSTIRYVPGDVL